MLTLAEHLGALNAKTLAWVAEDPANRWAGTYTEDLAHWAGIGVLTVRDLMRYEMECQYWDLHKEAYGFRPRGVNFSEMTYEELSDETSRLFRAADRAREEDAEYEYQSMIYAQEDAEDENVRRDEMPLPIDYVACHYQEGWL
jgi:hypothetical protein